jgi:ribosomal protein S18 acetylase RimI-like enzyme
MTAATTVTVRPAEEADRERVRQLWAANRIPPMAPASWNALTTGSASIVLVARDGAEVVGVLVASFDGWRAYVHHLVVEEQHRRRGVGSQLMREAERYLVSAGAGDLYLLAAQKNAEGLGLLRSLGYVPDGETVLVKPLARTS